VRRFPSAEVQLDVEAPAISMRTEDADVDGSVRGFVDDEMRPRAQVIREGRGERRVGKTQFQQPRVARGIRS